MMFVFSYLCVLYLSAPGSVILIDEAEKGLDYQSLMMVSQELCKYSDRLQFVLTTHHPHIINNIPPRDLKIVTREKGAIKVSPVSEWGIEDSEPEPMKRLSELKPYTTGRYEV